MHTNSATRSAAVLLYHAYKGTVMNRDRQYTRSRHPVQHLDGRQAAKVPRRTVDEDDELTEDEAYDDQWPNRLPTSTRTYVDMSQFRGKRYAVHPDQVIPRRRSAQPAIATESRRTDERPKRKRRGFFAHPLLYLGIGMLVMLVLWVGLQAVGSWWQRHLDDATYGYPRTWQTDAVVGHNNDSSANPSHFLFLNLNGHVEVIEIPAGDPTKMKVYIGPTLFSDNADLIPITGEFKDVNGDGKPDMIIHIQDSRIVFINENGQFRPEKPGEHITL